MPPLSPAIRTFLYRAWFGASLGYLAVAVLILRPTHWFGLVHCIWASVCVFGTWRLVNAEKKREATLPKQR